ncbi:MAG: prepilin-type N-terminal cleavage/methylation domain-containing protein [Candidatus Muiribacteriota bacterium]
MKKAYSLVEVLVSIALFLLLITPVFYLRTQNSKISHIDIETSLINRNLINITEILKSFGFNSIALTPKTDIKSFNYVQQSFGFPAITGKYTEEQYSIEVIQINPNLKKITVYSGENSLWFEISPVYF